MPGAGVKSPSGLFAAATDQEPVKAPCPVQGHKSASCVQSRAALTVATGKGLCQNGGIESHLPEIVRGNQARLSPGLEIHDPDRFRRDQQPVHPALHLGQPLQHRRQWRPRSGPLGRNRGPVSGSETRASSGSASCGLQFLSRQPLQHDFAGITSAQPFQDAMDGKAALRRHLVEYRTAACRQPRHPAPAGRRVIAWSRCGCPAGQRVVRRRTLLFAGRRCNKLRFLAPAPHFSFGMLARNSAQGFVRCIQRRLHQTVPAVFIAALRSPCGPRM